MHVLVAVVIAAVVAAGCSSRRGAPDELGAKDALLPAALDAYAAPLDLREFDVNTAEDGQRGVFLKLSRLPSSVKARSQSDPPRIILDIEGPTGTESAEEFFPAGDSYVTHVGVSRSPGWLRVVLDLQGTQAPVYAVYPMADWVVVRIKSPTASPRPWAHGAS